MLFFYYKRNLIHFKMLYFISQEEDTYWLIGNINVPDEN